MVWTNDTVRTSNPARSRVAFDAGLRQHMLKVYNYMATGLGVTGLVAAYTLKNQEFLMMLMQSGAMWGLFFAQIGLVFFISLRIQSLKPSTAQALFWVYAALMGLTIGPILLMYTGASVARTFFITAGMFGGMSLYGYTTQRDLSGLGSFLFMGLLGIILASVVNLFLKSSAVSFGVSLIGVLIFTGLTAYDTQMIKEIYANSDDADSAQRKAIIGALSLYMNFINLFLMLLRLLGDRR